MLQHGINAAVTGVVFGHEDVVKYLVDDCGVDLHIRDAHTVCGAVAVSFSSEQLARDTISFCAADVPKCRWMHITAAER